MKISIGSLTLAAVLGSTSCASGQSLRGSTAHLVDPESNSSRSLQIIERPDLNQLIVNRLTDDRDRIVGEAWGPKMAPKQYNSWLDYDTQVLEEKEWTTRNPDRLDKLEIANRTPSHIEPTRELKGSALREFTGSVTKGIKVEGELEVGLDIKKIVSIGVKGSIEVSTSSTKTKKETFRDEKTDTKPVPVPPFQGRTLEYKLENIFTQKVFTIDAVFEFPNGHVCILHSPKDKKWVEFCAPIERVFDKYMGGVENPALGDAFRVEGNKVRYQVNGKYTGVGGEKTTIAYKACCMKPYVIVDNIDCIKPKELEGLSDEEIMAVVEDDTQSDMDQCVPFGEVKSEVHN